MTAADLHPPSQWIVRWSHLVPAGGAVLDVACGAGRHVRWFHERNHPVTGVDQALSATESIANMAAAAIQADIENGPWPLPGRQFAAVVVTNYLWRPLLPTIVASVAAKQGAQLVLRSPPDGRPHGFEASLLLRPAEAASAPGPLR